MQVQKFLVLTGVILTIAPSVLHTNQQVFAENLPGFPSSKKVERSSEADRSEIKRLRIELKTRFEGSDSGRRPPEGESTGSR